MRFTNAIDTIGKGVDVVGVATIVVGVVAATVLSLRDQMDAASRYRIFRKRMGRAILLGLELLVAADIIRTVAVTPNLGERRCPRNHRRNPDHSQFQPRGRTRRPMAMEPEGGGDYPRGGRRGRVLKTRHTRCRLEDEGNVDS